jgi:hypothetical protein
VFVFMVEIDLKAPTMPESETLGVGADSVLVLGRAGQAPPQQRGLRGCGLALLRRRLGLCGGSGWGGRARIGGRCVLRDLGLLGHR